MGLWCAKNPTDLFSETNKISEFKGLLGCWYSYNIQRWKGDQQLVHVVERGSHVVSLLA